ncbi:MAG: DUF2799 domain-containing protein [Paracoccaceae bacterium]
MSIRFIATIVALGLGLSGCASLTPQQCMNGNWAEIGARDGAAGRGADYINAHRDACSELGIVPDPAAWLAGRQAGLARYCTPENAYINGRNGSRLEPVCTPAQRISMSRAYDWGLQYFALQTDINEANAEIARIRAVILNELSHPDLTPEEADRLASLEFRIRRLQSDIRMDELRQRRYAQLPF